MAYRIGPMVFDPLDTRLLDAEGLVLARLAPKEAELLHELLKRCGEVCQREELIEAVWSRNPLVGDASLPKTIYKLRGTLASLTNGATIQTVPRRGYCIDGDIEELNQEPAAASGSEVPGSHAAGRGSVISRVALLLCMSLVAGAAHHSAATEPAAGELLAEETAEFVVSVADTLARPSAHPSQALLQMSQWARERSRTDPTGRREVLVAAARGLESYGLYAAANVAFKAAIDFSADGEGRYPLLLGEGRTALGMGFPRRALHAYEAAHSTPRLSLPEPSEAITGYIAALVKVGRLNDAFTFLEEELARAHSRPDDPRGLALLNARGYLAARQGRVADAERYFLDALDQLEGSAQPGLAVVRHNLGLLRALKMDAPNSAEPHLVAAYGLAKQEFPLGHPVRAKRAGSLAALRRIQGREDDAEAIYRAALLEALAVLEPNDVAVVHLRAGLLKLLKESGRQNESLALIDEAALLSNAQPRLDVGDIRFALLAAEVRAVAGYHRSARITLEQLLSDEAIAETRYGRRASRMLAELGG